MVILHFCEPIPLIGVATFDGVWGFFSQDFHHVLTKKKKKLAIYFLRFNKIIIKFVFFKYFILFYLFVF
jgi:hypothetical protein